MKLNKVILKRKFVTRLSTLTEIMCRKEMDCKIAIYHTFHFGIMPSDIFSMYTGY